MTSAALTTSLSSSFACARRRADPRSHRAGFNSETQDITGDLLIATLPLEAAGRTEVGPSRDINQDVFALRPDLGLHFVIDGMGGHAAGELAAAIAAESIVRFYEEHRASWPEGVTMSPGNRKRLLLVAAL